MDAFGQPAICGLSYNAIPLYCVYTSREREIGPSVSANLSPTKVHFISRIYLA
jgi:hypothetical protein